MSAFLNEDHRKENKKGAREVLKIIKWLYTYQVSYSTLLPSSGLVIKTIYALPTWILAGFGNIG